MDAPFGIFADLAIVAFEAASALLEIVVSLVAGAVELLIYLVCAIISLVVPEYRRPTRISERSRCMLRRTIVAMLVLGSIAILVHCLWLREPEQKVSTPPSSKIEKTLRVIEKVKEVLPSRSQP